MSTLKELKNEVKQHGKTKQEIKTNIFPSNIESAYSGSRIEDNECAQYIRNIQKNLRTFYEQNIIKIIQIFLKASQFKKLPQIQLLKQAQNTEMKNRIYECFQKIQNKDRLIKDLQEQCIKNQALLKQSFKQQNSKQKLVVQKDNQMFDQMRNKIRQKFNGDKQEIQKFLNILSQVSQFYEISRSISSVKKQVLSVLDSNEISLFETFKPQNEQRKLSAEVSKTKKPVQNIKCSKSFGNNSDNSQPIQELQDSGDGDWACNLKSTIQQYQDLAKDKLLEWIERDNLLQKIVEKKTYQIFWDKKNAVEHQIINLIQILAGEKSNLQYLQLKKDWRSTISKNRQC